jgi:hypothetical protein
MRSAALGVKIAFENRHYALEGPLVEPFGDDGQRMEAVAKYLDEKGQLVPGDKQCMFCKAVAGCPARARQIAKGVFDDFDALTDAEHIVMATPRPPAGERLGALWNAVDGIRDWCTAIEEEVLRQVAAGFIVLGTDGAPMKLVEGKKPKRYWKVGNLPPEKVYKKEILTVAAAAKILDKKRTKATWMDFVPLIGQGDGKPTVALGSDPRPKFEGSAGADEFDDLTEEDDAE